MSAKRRHQPLKPARSVADVSNPTVIPVDFPSGAADALAETQEYYTYFRQRAAEKPLQTRVLSRARQLSKDEKKRWREFGELKRTRLMSTIDTLISELETDPPIDVYKKLSIARTVWSILQIEMDDASHAIGLERKASEHDYKLKSAQHARNKTAKIAKIEMLVAKRFVDEYIIRHPDASQSEVATNILRGDLSSELKKSGAPEMKPGRKLRGLISAILKNAEPNGRRKFQKRLPGGPCPGN
jgi:hypothetical protein